MTIHTSNRAGTKTIREELRIRMLQILAIDTATPAAHHTILSTTQKKGGAQ